MTRPASVSPHAVRFAPGAGSRLVLALAALAAAASAASAATIHGRVLDPDGRATPGAEVRLDGPLGLSPARITDGHGAFTFDRLRPATYVVRVVLPGFRAEPRRVAVTSAGEIRLEVVLQVSAISESVVVSATQVATPLSEAPASVSVLSADDMAARQHESLTDALRTVPGMTVAQSGGRGALTSVFPRGGESDYTLVLVDGVRLNAFGGGFDFGTLGEGLIERVEIVRGPQSALFGADAIGGVVHIVTRRGGPLRAGGLLEGGTQATARAVASASGALGAFHWGAGAERLTSDGYEGPTWAGGEVVTNDDARRTTASGSLGYLTPAWHLRGLLRSASSERGYPGPFGSDPNRTFGGVDPISRGWTRARAAAGGASRAVRPVLRLRADASFHDGDSRFLSPYGLSASETRRTTGRIQLDTSPGATLSLSGGLEALGERATSTFITTRAGGLQPVSRGVIGSFVEARVQPASRAFITAGLRVERISRAVLPGLDDPFSPRPDFDGDVVVSANPKVAASVALREATAGRGGWTRVRGSAGTGIRPPDAFEIAFTDNPSLRPERSRSVDVGVEHAMAGGRAIADATWFHNRYGDLIVAVGHSFRDASRYRTDNISNARARGLELGMNVRTRTGLDARAAYTWLDTAILDIDGRPGIAPAPFAPGDPLIRRARHRASCDVLFTEARWNVFVRAGARGRVTDVDPSFGAFGGQVEGPGYVTFDAGGGWTLRRGLEAFARVTNLFDRRHEEAVGFPALPRAAMVGVRLAAGR
jgi:outer membrane cobalamin receptor